MRHILNLLASSLNNLVLDATLLSAYPLIGTIPLPHLTHLRHVGKPWRVIDVAKLPSQSTITSLCLGPEEPQLTAIIPSGVLPQLRELSAPCSVGKYLIPGRPVTYFRDTSLKKVPMGEIDDTLSYFTRSTAGITDLEMCAELTVPSLFAALERRVPRIERFRLLTESDRFRHNPAFAAAPENAVRTGAAALKEVEIRFRAWLDCHKPPFISTSNCRTIFEALERACVALEVVTFTVVGSGEKFEEDTSDLPPQSIFKFCKTGTGAWEERRWGTYICAGSGSHGCSPRRI